MGTRRGVGGGRERLFTLYFFLVFVHVPIACFFFIALVIPVVEGRFGRTKRWSVIGTPTHRSTRSGSICRDPRRPLGRRVCSPKPADRGQVCGTRLADRARSACATPPPHPSGAATRRQRVWLAASRGPPAAGQRSTSAPRRVGRRCGTPIVAWLPMRTGGAAAMAVPAALCRGVRARPSAATVRGHCRVHGCAIAYVFFHGRPPTPPLSLPLSNPHRPPSPGSLPAPP